MRARQQIPSDAQYFIYLNDTDDEALDISLMPMWEAFSPGDRVFFKYDQILPLDFDLTQFSSDDELHAATKEIDPEKMVDEFGSLYRWLPKNLTWEKLKAPSVECMGWFAQEFKVYPIIRSSTMAKLTVELAAVMRKYGINCRFNEDLNCLQSAIAENFLEDWQGKTAACEYGAYDYWEKFHRLLEIKRPIENV